jgi:hypothetical protein
MIASVLLRTIGQSENLAFQSEIFSLVFTSFYLEISVCQPPKPRRIRENAALFRPYRRSVFTKKQIFSGTRTENSHHGYLRLISKLEAGRSSAFYRFFRLFKKLREYQM